MPRSQRTCSATPLRDQRAERASASRCSVRAGQRRARCPCVRATGNRDQQARACEALAQGLRIVSGVRRVYGSGEDGRRQTVDALAARAGCRLQLLHEALRKPQGQLRHAVMIAVMTALVKSRRQTTPACSSVTTTGTLRELIAGIRPLRSASERIRLRSRQLHEESVLRDTAAAHPEVPWARIAGLRNRIVHDYFGLDLEIIWQILQVDLPQLKSQLSAPRTSRSL